MRQYEKLKIKAFELSFYMYLAQFLSWKFRKERLLNFIYLIIIFCLFFWLLKMTLCVMRSKTGWKAWNKRFNLWILSDCMHCKYIRPHYDGTLAIHRSGTTTTVDINYSASYGSFLYLNWDPAINALEVLLFCIFGGLGS